MITLKNGTVLSQWDNSVIFPIDLDFPQKFDLYSQFGENAYGFVYRLSFYDTKGNKYKYIGRKNLFTERKRNFGKKELALITDKRLKTYEMVKKESDWLKYYSSNKKIKELVASGEVKFIQRSIVDIAYSKKELTYLETKALFDFDVLKDDYYLNDNILGKFYSKDFNYV